MRQMWTKEEQEEEMERARLRAEAVLVQQHVAEVMRAGRPPLPAEPPAASYAQQVMYTPAWFVALPRAEYQALLERYVFPDLDDVNWCLVPDTSEFAEAGIYGEGYRDIEQSEWEEKHREWQVLSENKIKFQQQYDVMHQQMLNALLVVEQRARQQLVLRAERTWMFLVMRLTLCAVEQREATALLAAEAREWQSIALGSK